MNHTYVDQTGGMRRIIFIYVGSITQIRFSLDKAHKVVHVYLVNAIVGQLDGKSRVTLTK